MSNLGTNLGSSSDRYYTEISVVRTTQLIPDSPHAREEIRRVQNYLLHLLLDNFKMFEYNLLITIQKFQKGLLSEEVYLGRIKKLYGEYSEFKRSRLSKKNIAEIPMFNLTISGIEDLFSGLSR